MQYLVSMEATEAPVWPSEEREKFRIGVVVPGHEVLEQLRAEGNILTRGLIVGRRNSTFIADVANNDELDEVIRSIPWHHYVHTEITALKSWGPRPAR